MGFFEIWLYLRPRSKFPRLVQGLVISCLHFACKALLAKTMWLHTSRSVFLPLNCHQCLASLSPAFHSFHLLWGKRYPLFCVRIIPSLFSGSHFLRLLRALHYYVSPFLESVTPSLLDILHKHLSLLTFLSSRIPAFSELNCCLFPPSTYASPSCTQLVSHSTMLIM